MLNQAPEATFGLSTYRALPIPDYLAPPGINIIHDDKGGHITIDSSYNMLTIFSDQYTDLVRSFLLSSYPDEFKNKPEELYKLAELYSESLALEFNELQRIYREQASLIALGKFEDADLLNQHETKLSIPNTLDQLSLRPTLLHHLATKLSQLNPSFHRLSSTEIYSSFEVVEVKPGKHDIIGIDKETIRMVADNSRLRTSMEKAIENKSEKELLQLFLLPNEEIREYSINLVPTLFTTE